jgi:hypothetical protein
VTDRVTPSSQIRSVHRFRLGGGGRSPVGGGDGVGEESDDGGGAEGGVGGGGRRQAMLRLWFMGCHWGGADNLL